MGVRELTCDLIFVKSGHYHSMIFVVIHSLVQRISIATKYNDVYSIIFYHSMNRDRSTNQAHGSLTNLANTYFVDVYCFVMFLFQSPSDNHPWKDIKTGSLLGQVQRRPTNGTNQWNWQPIMVMDASIVRFGSIIDIINVLVKH
jgi:hypothetical protein